MTKSPEPHVFEEDADDYSMCICGVPADVHEKSSSPREGAAVSARIKAVGGIVTHSTGRVIR